MSDKCPFCGADKTWSFEHSTGLDLNFYCETALRGSDIWIRGNPCYEAELTRKDELLQRWLKNEINHVFQNSSLQEETKVSLAIPEALWYKQTKEE